MATPSHRLLAVGMIQNATARPKATLERLKLAHLIGEPPPPDGSDLASRWPDLSIAVGPGRGPIQSRLTVHKRVKRFRGRLDDAIVAAMTAAHSAGALRKVSTATS